MILVIYFTWCSADRRRGEREGKREGKRERKRGKKWKSERRGRRVCAKWKEGEKVRGRNR